MKIGVIVAMRTEFELISALMEYKTERTIGGISFQEGNIADRSVVLAKSGIGKVCSAMGTMEMIRSFTPDCIINTGVAGGIDTSLQVMDVVVGKEIVYHDVWCGEGNEYGQVQGMPSLYFADPRLYGIAMRMKSDVRLAGGLICSGDRFITDKEELKDIKDKFPQGLAVDMESCSIAQVCYMYAVPFLSFRVISDTPGVERHAEQYRDFWTTAPQKSFRLFRQLMAEI